MATLSGATSVQRPRAASLPNPAGESIRPVARASERFDLAPIGDRQAVSLEKPNLGSQPLSLGTCVLARHHPALDPMACLLVGHPGAQCSRSALSYSCRVRRPPCARIRAVDFGENQVVPPPSESTSRSCAPGRFCQSPRSAAETQSSSDSRDIGCTHVRHMSRSAVSRPGTVSRPAPFWRAAAVVSSDLTGIGSSGSRRACGRART
jgi:hypothetical protein